MITGLLDVLSEFWTYEYFNFWIHQDVTLNQGASIYTCVPFESLMLYF